MKRERERERESGGSFIYYGEERSSSSPNFKFSAPHFRAKSHRAVAENKKEGGLPAAPTDSPFKEGGIIYEIPPGPPAQYNGPLSHSPFAFSLSLSVYAACQLLFSLLRSQWNRHHRYLADLEVCGGREAGVLPQRAGQLQLFFF